MNIENPVFVSRKFENKQPSGSAGIHFHVAIAHPWGFRRFRAPRSGHRVTVRVEFRLNVGKTLDRLSVRRFHLKLEQWRWPVQIQNVWLSCTPIPKPDAPMANIDTQTITSPMNSQTRVYLASKG